MAEKLQAEVKTMNLEKTTLLTDKESFLNKLKEM